MFTFYGILAFATLLVAIISYRNRGHGLLPSKMFGLFFMVTWSPLVFIPIEQTHINNFDLSYVAQIKFTISYCLMCICISIGLVVGRWLMRVGLSRVIAPPPLSMGEYITLRNTTGLVAIMLVFSYFLSVEWRAHILDTYNYLKSLNILSYNELRRGTIREGIVMGEFYGRLQYSLIFMIFTTFLVFGFRDRIKITAWLVVAGILFVLCAATLSKLPYAYFLFASMLMILLHTQQHYVAVTSKLILYPLAIGAISTSMYGLYVLQYKDNAYFNLTTILKTLGFRIFRAYPDGYKLYVELYPDVYPYNYGRTVSFLEPVFGFVDQPYLLVPQYFGAGGTTFPSGYVSYAYASFGMPGVAITSFIVGILLVVLDVFVLARPRLELQKIARVTLAMATFWLCSSPLTTSLLSGGLLLMPLLFILYEKLILPRRNARFGKL